MISSLRKRFYLLYGIQNTNGDRINLYKDRILDRISSCNVPSKHKWHGYSRYGDLNVIRSRLRSLILWRMWHTFTRSGRKSYGQPVDQRPITHACKFNGTIINVFRVNLEPAICFIRKIIISESQFSSPRILFCRGSRNIALMVFIAYTSP